MPIDKLWNIPEIENIPLAMLAERGILTKTAALKLIHAKKLKAIKILSRWYVPRWALIEYLKSALRDGEKEAENLKWAEERIPKRLKEEAENE